MQIISEWKKRPRDYRIQFGQRMAEVTINGRTCHALLNGDNEVIKLGNRKEETKRVEGNVFKVLVEGGVHWQ